jgi:hypothetical protein
MSTNFDAFDRYDPSGRGPAARKPRRSLGEHYLRLRHMQYAEELNRLIHATIKLIERMYIKSSMWTQAAWTYRSVRCIMALIVLFILIVRFG